MISTFNQYHLGDNLVHLNFLRKLAQKYPDENFDHYVSAQHIPQLAPLVADLPNLSVNQFTEPATGAINAWRGSEGFWHNHEKREDFVLFHFDWFEHLAKKMGLVSPILTQSDLLFDYPALKQEAGRKAEYYDYLVINSIPHSGQLGGFNQHEYTELVQLLLARGMNVITTAPTGTGARSTHDGTNGLSVTGIGQISQRVGCIVGVATGPIWTTFNIWNREVKRIIMLDYERLHLVPNVEHVRNCAEAMKFL